MQPENIPMPSNLLVLTFNMLAPCYKRMYTPVKSDSSERESNYHHLWKARLEAAITLLTSIKPQPDVIALQELWFNPQYLETFEAALKPYYHIFYAKRPQYKQDGLATLIHRQSPHLSIPTQIAAFPIPNSSDTDRVALAVSSYLNPPTCSSQPNNSTPTRLLIVNTHLTFPHCFINRRQREMQAETLTKFVTSYVSSSTTPISSLILGDFNSEIKSNVLHRITKENFINCYVSINDITKPPTTHYNHMKQQVFVDHIFLSNHLLSTNLLSYSKNSNTTLPRRPRPTSRDQLSSSTIQSRSVSPSPVGIRDTAPQLNTELSLLDTKISTRHSRKLTDRPEMQRQQSQQQLRCYIQPTASTIHPQSLQSDTWPVAFDISDHRPVAIQFDVKIASN